MQYIWIDRQHSRLKGYSATTRGSKSVVKIEIEVIDPHELGDLLNSLGKLEKEQKDGSEKKPKRDPVAGFPAPCWQIDPRSGDDS